MINTKTLKKLDPGTKVLLDYLSVDGNRYKHVGYLISVNIPEWNIEVQNGDPNDVSLNKTRKPQKIDLSIDKIEEIYSLIRGEELNPEKCCIGDLIEMKIDQAKRLNPHTVLNCYNTGNARRLTATFSGYVVIPYNTKSRNIRMSNIDPKSKKCKRNIPEESTVQFRLEEFVYAYSLLARKI